MLTKIIEKINTLIFLKCLQCYIIRHDNKISLLFDLTRLPDVMFPKPMQAQTLNP